MKRRKFLETAGKSSIAIICVKNLRLFDSKKITTKIQQITCGPNHHFFGYIGQSLTIPWNSTGTHILTLGTTFHDHLPGGDEPADVSLINIAQKEGNYYKIDKVDQSLGYNLQQGTMFYWNPEKPESQFFFNDRNPKTGKVFTVIYDIKKGGRIREYMFEDTPVGNSGICPIGKSFLAINYARMARLRPVTGYKDATDWTEGIAAPKNDGIFIIDIHSGEKKLLISFEQLEIELNKKGFLTEGKSLFINHTLWNRDGEFVYFFVRAGWEANSDKTKRINVPCTIRANGKDLFVGHQHIGGHPEWGIGPQIIGSLNDMQAVYDILERKVVSSISTSDVISDPEGDISLSPNGEWFVNGYIQKGKNYYTIIRLTDGMWIKTSGFDKGEYQGDLRIDPAPSWNRQSNQILVSGISDDGTRQLYLISIN